MNEEEKKAIEELKEFIQGPCEICKYCSGAYRLNRKNIIQSLNLIEKLQKENEELKDKYATFVKMSSEVIANSIPVKKVKDKIEELNKKEQELQNSISAEERKDYSDANISWELMDINIRRETLQELLEGRK